MICQQNLDQPKPLNETEKRLVLLQLYELESKRAQVVAYGDWAVKEKELYEREKVVWQQALDTEKRATELAQKETSLAKEQASFYKILYESVVKKRGGFGCTIARIFTIGIYRCK